MPKRLLVWKKKPEEEDYDGALAFLTLVMAAEKSKKLIDAIRKARPVEYAPKDLLRAAGLSLLAREDPHVENDLRKIGRGRPLAPVLLVRGNFTKQSPLLVADGYHRICATFYYDESASIARRIVDRYSN